jgi:site-specific DNA-methyltransferase (adenine-specific)
MQKDNTEIVVEIQWHEAMLPLKELRPFERNPRTITEAQFRKLKESLLEDGYHSRIKVTRDFRVIGGHQRLRALKELGYVDIPVLVPSREIDDETFKRVLLRDNHSNGMFDMDMLSNDYDLEFLRDMGLHDVMDIPTIEQNEENAAMPGATKVCCPECGAHFTTKGNKVND